VLKQARRHEDAWGNSGRAPRILTLGTRRLSDQLHASAALPPRKESPVTTDMNGLYYFVM